MADVKAEIFVIKRVLIDKDITGVEVNFFSVYDTYDQAFGAANTGDEIYKACNFMKYGKTVDKDPPEDNG